jgi:hypothetical protein
MAMPERSTLRRAEVLDVPGAERFELYLYVSDSHDDDDLHRYTVEHWFEDRPEIETIAALFEEAKRDFSLLYPDVEAENYDVELRRLRPRETGRGAAANR